jgi:hypothetical protein
VDTFDPGPEEVRVGLIVNETELAGMIPSMLIVTGEGHDLDSIEKCYILVFAGSVDLPPGLLRIPSETRVARVQPEV